MSQTTPGTVILSLGNQSGVTVVDMDHPEREGAPGASTSTESPRVKRKYTRRHLDKQRHEAHSDKELHDGEEG